MIDLELVRDLLDAAVAFVNADDDVKLVAELGSDTLDYKRDDQFGNVPSFPLLGYSFNSIDSEDPYQATKTLENPTATTIDRMSEEVSKGTLSLTISDTKGDGDPNRGYMIAKSIKKWIRTQAARDLFAIKNVIIRFLNQAVANVSQNIDDGFFLARVGFDLRIDTSEKIKLETVPKMAATSDGSEFEQLAP